MPPVSKSLTTDKGAMAGVIALKKFTDTIPIVSPILVDPVGFGFARTHARPGGNGTGVLLTVEDLPSKQLALAGEMVPAQGWSAGEPRQSNA